MADRTSFLYYIDIAVRSLLYSKFNSFLGLSSLGSTDAERINKGVLLIPKPVAQRMVSEKRGENFLEFINVWRGEERFDWKRNRTLVARTGLIAQAEGSDAQTIKAVPASLDYSFWVWSRDLDALNDCVYSYLFWPHKNPKLGMTLEDTYSLNYDLHFRGSHDESPLDQMYDIGKYFVKRFHIGVDGWLYDLTETGGEISKIRLDCFDSTLLDEDAYTTVYLEDSNYNSELADALRMFRAKLYGIKTVDTSSNVFGILGDFSSDFSVDSQFFLENSTGNNGRYTVNSISWDGTYTNITVNESIIDNTVDGNIYIPQ